MSEYQDLHAMAQLLDPPGDKPGPALRQRITDGVAARRPVAVARSRRARWWSRPVVRFAFAGGLASLIAIAVLAAILTAPVARVGDHAPVAVASAADILRGAAKAAAAEPTVVPRADQFVYIESINDNSEAVVRNAVWKSVDGTRDGLARQTRIAGQIPAPEGATVDGTIAGCVNDKRQVVGTDQPEGCQPQPAYASDIPTDPAAARRHLYDLNYHVGSGSLSPDALAFTKLGLLLSSHYLAPAARAALFEGAAGIPGVSVTRGVADLAGRQGIAVGFPDSQLIFKEGTYEFLGAREMRGGLPHRMATETPAERPSAVESTPAGEIKPVSAILRVVVVDRVGQTG